MIQPIADFLFALETIEEDLVAFYLGVRNLDRYLSARPEIGGAVNRGNITAGNNAVDAIVVELVAEINRESSFALLQCSRKRTTPAGYNSRPALSA